MSVTSVVSWSISMLRKSMYHIPVLLLVVGIVKTNISLSQNDDRFENKHAWTDKQFLEERRIPQADFGIDRNHRTNNKRFSFSLKSDSFNTGRRSTQDEKTKRIKTTRQGTTYKTNRRRSEQTKTTPRPNTPKKLPNDHLPRTRKPLEGKTKGSSTSSARDTKRNKPKSTTSSRTRSSFQSYRKISNQTPN